MKRNVLRFLAVILLGCFLLSGCNAGIGKSGSRSSSSSMPKTMQKFLAMSDDKLTEKLSDLDLCIDDLVFTNSKNISSDILYSFFCYIVQSDDYSQDYCKKWYNEKNDIYRIPLKDVVAVLNKYFDGVNFKPEKLSKEYGYNPKTKMLVNHLEDFGGGRWPKLAKKEKLSNNTLRVTIKFYDETYKKVEKQKVFTIRFYDTGYKYLSIVEK